jgi:iron complex outermembrane receptor protein
LLNAPRHSGSVWGVYSFDLGPLQGLKLGAGVFAIGEREGNNENTFQLPDYVRVDLLAAYEWKLGSSTLTAQLNVENLADEEYFNPAAPFQAFVAPGAPRTFLGSIRFQF